MVFYWRQINVVVDVSMVPLGLTLAKSRQMRHTVSRRAVAIFRDLLRFGWVLPRSPRFGRNLLNLPNVPRNAKTCQDLPRFASAKGQVLLVICLDSVKFYWWFAVIWLCKICRSQPQGESYCFSRLFRARLAEICQEICWGHTQGGPLLLSENVEVFLNSVFWSFRNFDVEVLLMKNLNVLKLPTSSNILKYLISRLLGRSPTRSVTDISRHPLTRQEKSGNVGKCC